MPRIEDIELFKNELEEIGNQAQVLADHGLSPEPFSPPSPDELDFMVGSNTLKVRANPNAPGQEEENQTTAFDDLFGSLADPEDEGSDDSATDSNSDSFTDSLADLFGDTDTDTDTETDTESDTDIDTDIDTGTDTGSGDSDQAAEDDWAVPDFSDEIPTDIPEDDISVDPEEEALLDDFLSSFGTQEDSFGEPEPETEPEAESEPEPAIDAELDLDDFSLEETDFDLGEQEGEPETPVEEEDLSGIETDEEDLEAFGEDLFSDDEFGTEESFEEPMDLAEPEDAAEEPQDDLEALESLEPEGLDEFTEEGFGDGDFGTDEFETDDFSFGDDGGSETPVIDDLADEEFGSDEFGETEFGETEFGESDFADTTQDDGVEPLPLDLDGDLEAEFGDEFSDEFSMGDFGAEFGILEDVIDTSLVDNEQTEGEIDAEEFAAATIAEQAGGFKLTEDQFNHLKQSLEAQPLNIKLAVTEIISEGKYPFEDMQRLIQALVDGEPPKKIAAIASKISGKRLSVPKNYEKRSGLAFAEEQQTFLYQFKERIWPVMKVATIIAVASVLLIWLSYTYIYTPLYARSLYNQGLAAIAAQQYPRANTLFDRAYAIWPNNNRFFDYAHAFIAQRQYRLAQEKYLQLLRIDRNNRRGILEYADFAAYTMRDYQTGLDILERLLTIDKNDYDPLLAQADIYMEWARYTTDPALRAERYDAARSAYVRLTNVHGQTDPLLFRLLLYYVRTGNLAKSFQLQQVFDADPRVTIEPRIYAELAGFYIDTWTSGQTSPIFPHARPGDVVPTGFGPDLLEEAQKLLFAALEKEPRIPEIHYNLARSFAEQTRFDQERRALESARILFNEVREHRSLNQFEVAQEIDTVIRIGESNERTGNSISAEMEYRRAMSLHNQAKQNLQVQPSHTFGRLYANLGNMYYYQGNDYAAALEFFTQALENGFGLGNRPTLPSLVRDLHYKKAFIHYGTGSAEGFQNALSHLVIAEGPTPTVNPNLMFAKANTLYQLGNYHAAAAIYERLIDRLVQQRQRISTFLLEEDRTHRGLIDFKIRAYNNLGVTLYQLSRTAGVDRIRRQVQAQYYLSKATELAENVARDIETAVRADTRNLAFLNLRSILVPGFSGEVLIDPDLPKDLQVVTF